MTNLTESTRRRLWSAFIEDESGRRYYIVDTDKVWVDAWVIRMIDYIGLGDNHIGNKVAIFPVK